MLARNGERPGTDCTVNGARKFLGTGNAQTSKPNTNKSQAPVYAELTGSTRAIAANILATGTTPVLMLCRQLLAAGSDPDRPLHAYRGTSPALRVRSIREGAALTVKTAGNGSPIFAALEGAAAPPIDLRDGQAAGSAQR